MYAGKSMLGLQRKDVFRMIAIWKFELAITDEQTIEMPRYHTILSVGNRDGKLCLWALVNPSLTEQKVKKRFLIWGTEHQYERVDGSFIGTVVVGAFAWHIFDGGIG